MADVISGMARGGWPPTADASATTTGAASRPARQGRTSLPRPAARAARCRGAQLSRRLPIQVATLQNVWVLNGMHLSGTGLMHFCTDVDETLNGKIRCSLVTVMLKEKTSGAGYCK